MVKGLKSFVNLGNSSATYNLCLLVAMVAIDMLEQRRVMQLLLFHFKCIKGALSRGFCCFRSILC